jgi:hypothetical protein
MSFYDGFAVTECLRLNQTDCQQLKSVASNDWMTVNNEFEGMWTVDILVEFKYLPGIGSERLRIVTKTSVRINAGVPATGK